MRANPDKIEEVASQNAEQMRSIADRAKEHGLIAHRFYGNEDGGQVMVIDEWPDRESFERFFGSVQDEIQPLMQQSGVEGEPGINFWRKLDTHDEVGWGA
jgi:heme-degrading monooxygenase HmoA